MSTLLFAAAACLALGSTPTVGPPAGSLLIHGGGRLSPEVVARFVELAGGPDAEFVVIPTANEMTEPEARRTGLAFARDFGVKHVSVLHTTDRAVADTEAFWAPLKKARAVWFGGGRQWRLVDSYLGTRTQREIEGVLARGGVIGGSSAGATIQGSYLVRGAREGNHIMMAKGYEQGFAYLKDVAVDQHLIARHREDDMVAVVEAHPELLGIGIDESTAVVVQGDAFEVIGKSKVAVYDGKDHGGKRYQFLGAGDRFDLKERRPLPLALAAVQAAGSAAPDPMKPDLGAPRPIGGPDTVFLEELTWMEARDAIKAGKDTVIVATGGMEQNGPYLAAGKHNYVLRATTEAIARKLGNALVAPIVAFVPEGDIDPPSLHMPYPTTISLREETYRALLTDICASLGAHGFNRVILIGDSGGNQDGMKQVAQELNARWARGNKKARAYFIPEYYDYPEVTRWLESQGIKQVPEGIHDDFAITATMMTVNPETVRMKERIAAGKFRINGVDLAPAEKTIEWGKKIVDHRATLTVEAIRKAGNRPQ